MTAKEILKGMTHDRNQDQSGQIPRPMEHQNHRYYIRRGPNEVIMSGEEAKRSTSVP